MDIGFVYILANRSMPDIYKVGCTERSPARRAHELSSATACPESFDVVCFWEGEDFHSFEKELHSVFTENRVNQGREFFRGPLHWLVRCMDSWHEEKHGFYITRMGHWYLAEEKQNGTR